MKLTESNSQWVNYSVSIVSMVFPTLSSSFCLYKLFANLNFQKSSKVTKGFHSSCKAESMRPQIHISFVSTNTYFYYIKMKIKAQVKKPQKYKYILLLISLFLYCISFYVTKILVDFL